MDTEMNVSEDLKKENSPTKKRKGGRPEASVKRNKSLMVRLTPMERMLIEGKAREAGIPTTEWFRKAAKKARVERRLTAEDLGILHMLAALANTLTDLAKMAQAEGFFSIHQICREILPEIQKTLNRMNRDDRKGNDR